MDEVRERGCEMWGSHVWWRTSAVPYLTVHVDEPRNQVIPYKGIFCGSDVISLNEDMI